VVVISGASQNDIRSRRCRRLYPTRRRRDVVMYSSRLYGFARVVNPTPPAWSIQGPGETKKKKNPEGDEEESQKQLHGAGWVRGVDATSASRSTRPDQRGPGGRSRSDGTLGRAAGNMPRVPLFARHTKAVGRIGRVGQPWTPFRHPENWVVVGRWAGEKFSAAGRRKPNGRPTLIRRVFEVDKVLARFHGQRAPSVCSGRRARSRFSGVPAARHRPGWRDGHGKWSLFSA